MVYLKWIFYMILSLLVIVVRYPLAPIAVYFFSSKDKKTLTRFRWLETIDNDLGGDSYWSDEHISGDKYSNLNRIRWLWRNGGNAVNYKYLGVPAEGWRLEEEFIPNPETGNYIKVFIKRRDCFLYRKFKKVSDNPVKYREIFIGWALQGPQLGICKIVCSVRKRSADN